MQGKESDVSGRDGMDKYLKSCEEFSRSLRNKMLNAPVENGYYIWGVGTNTAMLVQEGIVNIEDVKGIFDSNRNYEGYTAYGQKIQLPSMLKKRLPLPILISSQYAYGMIKKSMEDMGLENEIINLYEI